MRILDCKVDTKKELMKNAPKLLDFLGEESKKYFKKVLSYLDDLKIKYEVDSNLVRGLDYYTHTAFEIMIDNKDIELKTLCGGGRYNGLIKMLGGPEEEKGIGFALSIERLLLALESENIELNIDDKIDIYVVSVGEEANEYSMKLTNLLRIHGFKAQNSYFDKKIKAQMKIADRYKAKFSIIIGEEEIKDKKVTVKNMENHNQESIKIENLMNYLKEKIKGE